MLTKYFRLLAAGRAVRGLQALCLSLAISLLLASHAVAVEPIVIGQSLPLGATDSGSSRRIVEGGRAYIEAVNAAGGIGGRLLKLVTLDNANDPIREASNIRALVAEHKAVAILTCFGDSLCSAAASVSAELGVALVGPMATGAGLNRLKHPFLFRIRATFDKEAAALARQLRSLALLNVLVVTDMPKTAGSVEMLQDALRLEKIRTTVIMVDRQRKESFEALMPELVKGGFQAVVFDLGPQAIETMTAGGFEKNSAWPLVVATTSMGSINALMSSFKGRMFGFTTVVPSPEARAVPLARELQRHVDDYAEGAGVTYEGMEAYINARVLVEGLRRAAPKLQPGNVVSALNEMPDLDLGGFRVSTRPGRSSASDFVDIAVRSRDGAMQK